ncbi:hypothetical protein [Pseudomonas sp. TE3610]
MLTPRVGDWQPVLTEQLGMAGESMVWRTVENPLSLYSFKRWRGHSFVVKQPTAHAFCCTCRAIWGRWKQRLMVQALAVVQRDFDGRMVFLNQRKCSCGHDVQILGIIVGYKRKTYPNNAPRRPGNDWFCTDGSG